MLIRVTASVGSGPTPLGAFDAALRSAGIGDYNLLPLSSVIPTGSVVKKTPIEMHADHFGDRLYVVIARHEASTIGEEAWAGLGWTQEPKSGRGLFVELHGTSRRSVEVAIDATLESMKQARPIGFGKNEHEITGIMCEGDPVCALVVAAYSREPW